MCWFWNKIVCCFCFSVVFRVLISMEVKWDCNLCFFSFCLVFIIFILGSCSFLKCFGIFISWYLFFLVLEKDFSDGVVVFRMIFVLCRCVKKMAVFWVLYCGLGLYCLKEGLCFLLIIMSFSLEKGRKRVECVFRSMGLLLSMLF